jgi:hypothetical protein
VLRLFGFNLNIFKKNISATNIEILEKLQRYLTYLLPESLEETSSIHPVPGYIDWRYAQTMSDPVVKLQHCIKQCMKIAPKSKQELVKLTTVINKYLAKPQRERSHESELSFRTEISRIAPKIIQSWIKYLGFKCDRFWDRYLYYHIDI